MDHPALQVGEHGFIPSGASIVGENEFLGKRHEMPYRK
jgi:hypothetical protein